VTNLLQNSNNFCENTARIPELAFVVVISPTVNRPGGFDEAGGSQGFC
jgi:hypothetical protein